MKIAIIDNYDSFTYNLCHAVEAAGASIDVMRNDHIDMRRVAASDKIILSPGPGIPLRGGRHARGVGAFRLYETHTRRMSGTSGHRRALRRPPREPRTCISRRTDTHIARRRLPFESLPRTIEAGRYHSWVVSRDGLPDELEVTALSDEGQIMALRHRTADIRGLQFHPESILTPQGDIIIRNWINH